MGIKKKKQNAIWEEIFRGFERAGSPTFSDHVAERESGERINRTERERDWRLVVNSKTDRPFIDSLVLDSLFHFHPNITSSEFLSDKC